MARAGAIRILLLPFRSSLVLSKMVRAGAIRILLLPFRSFFFCLRWPGPEPSQFYFAVSFVYRFLSKMVRAGAIRILLLPVRSFSVRCLSKMARAGAIRILLPPFVRFQFSLIWSGLEPSELSFCLFVCFLFV